MNFASSVLEKLICQQPSGAAQSMALAVADEFSYLMSHNHDFQAPAASHLEQEDGQEPSAWVQLLCSVCTCRAENKKQIPRARGFSEGCVSTKSRWIPSGLSILLLILL